MTKNLTYCRLHVEQTIFLQVGDVAGQQIVSATSRLPRRCPAALGHKKKKTLKPGNKITNEVKTKECVKHFSYATFKKNTIQVQPHKERLVIAKNHLITFLQNIQAQ